MHRPSRKYTYWIALVTVGMLLWMTGWLMGMRVFERAGQHLVAIALLITGCVVGVVVIVRLGVLHVHEVKRWMNAIECKQCGYSLRGLDSEHARTCPECGAPFGDRTRRHLADDPLTPRPADSKEQPPNA